MSTRRMLDEVLDLADARVLVERDADGRPTSARFDLRGLPRVDGLLAGRPVADVPALVERLCGICPAAHHLAGTRALEALLGVGPLTPTADAVRRLLHHAAALDQLAPRLASTSWAEATALRGLARAGLAAAGSPGHFPVTAVPGGVAAPVPAVERDRLAGLVAPALAAAVTLARALLADATPTRPFDGADVALVDEGGTPDLLGSRLRAVAADGTPAVPDAPADQWDAVVAEAEPGASAPRPYLLALGRERGGYRVGPVAQLRGGAPATPTAAALRAQWLTAGAGAAAARAVLAVHAVEAIAALLDDAALVAGPVTVPVPATAGPRVGVGWVDSPRGLLVHRYAADADGILTRATILTPTAQNEPWLAALLARAATTDRAAGPGTGSDAMLAGMLAGMEDAVREADPCLPCTSTPAGLMGLQVATVPGDVVRPAPSDPAAAGPGIPTSAPPGVR